MICLNIDREPLPIPPLFFTGGEKVQNLAIKGVWFQKGATYQFHKTHLLRVFEGLMSPPNLV